MNPYTLSLEVVKIPQNPHAQLFTYSECFAQVESGSRVHRFGIVEKEARTMVMFFRRRQYPEPNAAWRQMDITDESAQKIKSALESIRLPLVVDVQEWSSMHFNRSLEFYQQGTLVTLWWDSGSNLVSALKPLTSAISEHVALAKAELEKDELAVGDADERF